MSHFKVVVLALMLILFPAHVYSEIIIVGKHRLSRFEQEDLKDVLRGGLEWVARNSLYTYTEEVLTVEFVSPDELDPGCRTCPVAYFSWDSRRLLLSTKLDVLHNPLDESVVVHEVVHYFQMLAGKSFDENPQACWENMTLELEAYKLQREYYRSHGGGLNRIQAPTPSCNDSGNMRAIPVNWR